MMDEPRDGIFRQELVTYSIKNGRTTKTIVTRLFHENDYTDSETNIPLAEVK